MRRLALLLLASSLCHATIAYVASTSVANPANTATTTSSPIDTTGATALFIVKSGYATNGCTYSTPTDSKGNAWTCLGTDYQSPNGAARVTLWYSIPTSVGPGHTVTFDGGYMGMVFAAFSGTAASGVLDTKAGAGQNGVTTIQPGSLTPSANDELLITSASSWTILAGVDAPFSSHLVQNLHPLGVNVGVALAYEIQTTATARNPTWSISGTDDAAALIAAFAPVSGPPPCCSSAASGNWHDPTTWGYSAGTCSSGVTCPADAGGQNVTIGNGHTVTCESGQTCGVGTSPASDGTPRALTCTSGSSGTGVLVVNGTLVYKGSVESCAADWTISAGATVRYDDSGSGGAAYYGWHMHTGRLLLSGTSGSHAAWTTVSSAQSGLVGSDTYGTGEGQVLSSYADFSHIGNTKAFLMYYPGSTGSWTMDHSTCVSCASSTVGSNATSVLHVKNSSMGPLYIMGSALPSTGERMIANSTVGGLSGESLGLGGLTLANVVLTTTPSSAPFASYNTGGSIASWDSVLLANIDLSSVLPSGTMTNTYVLTWSNSVSDRMHQSFAQSYSVPTVLDTWVWESTSNDTGTALTQPEGNAAYPVEYLRQLVLPSPNGGTGGILAVDTSGTTAVKTYQIQHNTQVLSVVDANGAGATVENNGAVPTTWPAGTITAFSNNLFWHASSLAGTAALSPVTTGTANDGALTGVDYNWFYNLPASADTYTHTAATAKYASPSPPGPHDTHIASAPPLVDTSRRLLLYDQQVLGANVATAWSGSHGTYNVGDLVSDSAGGIYGGATINWRCTTAHTAASAQEPMVGAAWMSYWEPAALATIRTQVIAGQSGVVSALNWVRGGYIPTIPGVWCAGSDGDTPGAVAFCGRGKALIAAAGTI